MNPNIPMVNVNVMGGPMGAAPMPMMNHGAMPPHPGAPGIGPAMRQVPGPDRNHLNKYIYDYFLRHGMFDCARALFNSDNSVAKADVKNGNVGNGAGDDHMDTDSKDDLDSKLPEDLPPANIVQTGVQSGSDNSFLYDWFCLFWDMYHAQRSKAGNPHIHQYVNHTQAQSRLKQNQQQEMLRQMRPDMNMPPQFQQMQAMRNLNQNGAAAMAMNMKQNNLARAAMANNQNPQAMQMMQAKQGQMQRDPSEMEAMRQRAGSPGSDAAPSPSKRPRLEGTPFNPNQPGMMPNGRPIQGMPGQPGGPHNGNPNHMLMAAGVNTAGLAPGQIQNFANTTQAGQAKSIQSYSQNLQQHHGNQMPPKQMPNGAGPHNHGSPGMMPQGPDGINAYYNAGGGEMSGVRMGPGPGPQGNGASNHALQDYQMQLMLLEQQNKKRLLMARQEQDSMGGGGMPSRDGQNPPPGPQGPGAAPTNAQFADSPQTVRAGTSPNPVEQMKRGTPQMNNAGIPSPLGDGAPSRGSPNPAAFGMAGQMDPIPPPPFANMAQMNGMRPHSSHPGQPQPQPQQPPPQQPQPQPQQSQPGQFNAQQQMMAGRQGSQAGGPGNPPPGPQWQQGAPNGVPMVPQGSQNPMQQGTPRQGGMPPPSAPAAAAAVANASNNRPQTSSPQDTSKLPTPSPALSAKPKPSKKDAKKEGKKKGAAMNAAVTPAAEGTAEPEPPATPIIPANAVVFKNGAPAGGQPAANGQPGATAGPAPSLVPASQHGDQNGPSFMENPGTMVDFQMEFTNPLSSGNGLEDFDFDSFLQDGDGDNGAFDFNATFNNLEGAGEIGAAD